MVGEEAVHSGLTRLGFAIGGRIPQHGSTGDDHWIALPRTLEKDSGSFVGLRQIENLSFAPHPTSFLKKTGLKTFKPAYSLALSAR